MKFLTSFAQVWFESLNTSTFCVRSTVSTQMLHLLLSFVFVLLFFEDISDSLVILFYSQFFKQGPLNLHRTYGKLRLKCNSHPVLLHIENVNFFLALFRTVGRRKIYYHTLTVQSQQIILKLKFSGPKKSKYQFFGYSVLQFEMSIKLVSVA